LKGRIHESLRSTTGEPISALQERELEKGQQIAVQLHRDLRLCNSNRATLLSGTEHDFAVSRGCVSRVQWIDSVASQRSKL